jgi:hypothetical protein
MKAILFPVDKPTITGRIYTKECVEKMIGEYQSTIDKQRSLGFVDSVYPDLTKAAVLVTKLEIEDENLVASYDILKTPMGDQVETLLSVGHKFTSVCQVELSEIVSGVIKNAKFLSIDLVQG